MSKKILSDSQILSIIIFLLNIICLFITLKLLSDMMCYVNENELSFDIIGVGTFGLMLNWLRFALTSVLTLLSLVNLFVNFHSIK